jgi:hypothetical protein
LGLSLVSEQCLVGEVLVEPVGSKTKLVEHQGSGEKWGCMNRGRKRRKTMKSRGGGVALVVGEDLKGHSDIRFGGQRFSGKILWKTYVHGFG